MIASIANALAAIRRIFSAIAACSPIGTPHCTRSPLHSRAIASARFVTPRLAAGIDSRPELSVVNATFSPRPSPPRMFARGTFTFVKRITPL